MKIRISLDLYKRVEITMIVTDKRILFKDTHCEDFIIYFSIPFYHKNPTCQKRSSKSKNNNNKLICNCNYPNYTVCPFFTNRQKISPSPPLQKSTRLSTRYILELDPSLQINQKNSSLDFYHKNPPHRKR